MTIVLSDKIESDLSSSQLDIENNNERIEMVRKTIVHLTSTLILFNSSSTARLIIQNNLSSSPANIFRLLYTLHLWTILAFLQSVQFKDSSPPPPSKK